MSIGIPRAIDARGKPFDRWAIEDGPHPFVRPLRCGKCTALVDPVSGYVKRNGVDVEPLFRLTKGGRHDDGCPYDFDAQLGELQQRHANVVEQEGDLYVLILNTAADMETTSQTGSVRVPRSKLAFRRATAPPLHQTVRAASEIARLLRRFEQDSDARSRFRARYDGRVIGWDDFCFDATRDVKRLYGLLSRVDPLTDHPRAVVGRIERLRPGQDGASSAAHLAVREPNSTSRRAVTAPDGIRIAPVLRAGASTALNVTDGELVVGYGRWTLFTPDTGRVHYVTLWLDDHRGAVASLAE